MGVEKRQGILVGNGGPYSITCEIISNVSDAPGNTRICTLQKYVNKIKHNDGQERANGRVKRKKNW